MKSPPPAAYASSTANVSSRSARQPNTLPPRLSGNTFRSVPGMFVIHRTYPSVSGSTTREDSHGGTGQVRDLEQPPPVAGQPGLRGRTGTTRVRLALARRLTGRRPRGG